MAELDEIHKDKQNYSKMTEPRSKEDWDNIKITQNRIDSLNNLVYSSYLKTISEYPDSDISLYLFREILFLRYADFRFKQGEKLKDIYSSFSSKQRNSYIGKQITGIIDKPLVRINEVIPNMRLQDIDGKEHSLSEYKGKYLLIELWENPAYLCIKDSLIEAQISKNKDMLAYVTINMNADKEKWISESEKYKLDKYINLNDFGNRENTTRIFDLRAWPQCFLVSPEGIILQTWLGNEIKERMAQIGHIIEYNN
ncbi:MAG: hypothetical protein LBV43_11670 [Prevotella sp.]|nr:hypothetical protein [Prevotella sp.]